MRTVIGLTQTTSASYLLMSSLDIARKALATERTETFRRVVSLAEYARAEINRIGGYYAFSHEIIDNGALFGFDVTKLSVNTFRTGLADVEVYDLLRDDYGIQTEFGDMGNMLAIVSVGDNRYAIERLVAALPEIKRLHGREGLKLLGHEYYILHHASRANDAARGLLRTEEPVPVREGLGRITAESVMRYPPGIPTLSPGEDVTPEVLELHNSTLKKKAAS